MKRWMQALFRLAILHLRQRVRRLNYVRYIEKYLIVERMFVIGIIAILLLNVNSKFQGTLSNYESVAKTRQLRLHGNFYK